VIGRDRLTRQGGLLIQRPLILGSCIVKPAYGKKSQAQIVTRRREVALVSRNLRKFCDQRLPELLGFLVLQQSIIEVAHHEPYGA